ncbi:DUF1839 family protein [Brevibacillus dissolubilis]|uniref:DUF1839 family protein n=1 Tax=Brevibacillus dissolubilis TaxID=1844116 RepID=UPI00159BD072|nr:DUF1839 family protein [Brevibacillus dissolubilis]
MTQPKVEVMSMDAAQYVQHPFHREERLWQESNCYVDLFIEVLHQLGLDPTACFAFTMTSDFEGDQWTFYKNQHNDLFSLYGIDIQELQIWRPLIDHAIQQVELGRLVMMEADAYFLPDTLGTSYRNYHEKTTIAVQSIDLENRKLGYFHGPSYFELEGDDFDGQFHLGAYVKDANHLPLFVEIAKLDQVKHLAPKDLAKEAYILLGLHLKRRPATNPFARFREAFNKDIVWVKEEGLSAYHKYSFATLRQCGSCFEHAATYLRWLNEHLPHANLEPAATEFEAIASQAKTLLLKMARVVNSKRDADFDPIFLTMEENWAKGMRLLDEMMAAEAVGVK